MIKRSQVSFPLPSLGFLQLKKPSVDREGPRDILDRPYPQLLSPQRMERHPQIRISVPFWSLRPEVQRHHILQALMKNRFSDKF